MFNTFKELVAQGKVKRDRLNALRVKLHVPCQWSCFFCHMEGNTTSQSVRNDSHFTQTLLQFRDRFGFSEVHFTGGEPSIHPQIVDFISKASELGFKVKMTTNGQVKISRYEDCVLAGLQEINVSIHTLNGSELGKLMNPARSEAWGKKAIEKQLTLLDALADKVRVKVNTCVGEHTDPALEIASYIRERTLSWRLMNVLEIPEISYATLKSICVTLEAEAMQACVINGSSSCSIDMRCKDNFNFKLKLIQPHFLESMCSGCELKAHGGCYEYAYGPRLEMEKGFLMVRNCIHRDGPPFSLPVHSYHLHPLADDLLENIR